MQIRRILVPVDFQAASDRALDYAVALASKVHATVALLHVYDPAALGRRTPVEFVLDMRPRIAAGAAQALERMVACRAPAGVPLEWHLREGVPHEEVVRAIEEQNVDLVVMGGHGPVESALLGSVMAKVLTAALAPVLVVRALEPLQPSSSAARNPAP